MHQSRRYQDVTFVLLKNGAPVAQLVPNKEKVCTGRDLAAILSTARLTDRESKALRIESSSSVSHDLPEPITSRFLNL
jgi:antitoxin (DNA-binding transcriptional repressor) of toxin-antitoxin stability system